jgi:hypothetical protein
MNPFRWPRALVLELYCTKYGRQFTIALNARAASENKLAKLTYADRRALHELRCLYDSDSGLPMRTLSDTTRFLLTCVTARFNPS